MPGTMCVQCMMAAMTSVGAASGARSWVTRMKADWLTERRRKAITVGLFATAVLVAGTFSGSS